MNKPTNLDNSILLSLIDDWLKANGSGKTYENVVFELLNGNSFLVVQTYDQINENRTFVADENTKLKMSIYEIEGKNFFAAFTDTDLLTKWTKQPCFYAKLPSKSLLKMADKTEVDGIVINTNSENMFVVFRNSNL